MAYQNLWTGARKGTCAVMFGNPDARITLRFDCFGQFDGVAERVGSCFAVSHRGLVNDAKRYMFSQRAPLDCMKIAGNQVVSQVCTPICG